MKKSTAFSKNNLSVVLIVFFSYFTLPLQSTACGIYEADNIINSSIKEVTVFLQGAQVYRTGKFYAPKGVSEIVFSNISPYLNKNSIQAKGKGNFTILEVRHHIHYPPPPVVQQQSIPTHIKKHIVALEDSLLDLGFTISEIKAMKKTLEMEKEILLKTQLYKGQGKSSDSIPLLKDGMSFFRTKMNDINKQLFILNKKEVKVGSLEKKLSKRLIELKQYKSKVSPVINPTPIQQVIITVSSKQATSGTLDISYMVHNAGWSAHYDLRAKNTSSPIQLTYKAKVHQQTGEDWRNVRLKLSTNNPNKSNVKPNLPAWSIGYHIMRDKSINNLNSAVTLSELTVASSAKSKREKKEKDDEIILDDAQVASNYVQLSENISNVEFKIDLPYTIKSNGEAHLVEVQQKALPSKFHHVVVPKLDREAFVMAKMSGWNSLNLLPAPATIFFDGTYIGETSINPQQLSDTLLVSLGRDPSVIVERKKRMDETKPQAIGNNLVKTMQFNLVVKNKKNAPINLIIEDQIPITWNPDIKVSLEDKGDAKYNERNGSLTWDLSLNQGQEQKLDFSYSIKYNKDRRLISNL